MSAHKKALILGVGGQDGSYLAEILLGKAYEVHGLGRKTSADHYPNLSQVRQDKSSARENFSFHQRDATDSAGLQKLIESIRPDEIYNFADQGHPGTSFKEPVLSAQITGLAVAQILEIIRIVDPKIRFFQPCTSHMFETSASDVQTENTPFDPQSPYACAKTYAYYLCRYYRKTHAIFASTAILYNHESPRRPLQYVSRKISRSVAQIALGKLDKLILGDLSPRLDWGYAREFMEAAWRILQIEKADDFILATGEVHSVGEFVEEAFRLVNMKADDYIVSDKSLFRPVSNDMLRGDTSKARKAFGFNPQVKFKELVKMMVENDINLIERTT